ncbi:hypothetical protein PSTT_08298 [Puccinia striiformis]|uniref:Uncharacterized protein n=1 Tax=Puccinia striiformis TaxID=27350 RepID=A0A2S4VD26_9BASI|nr:hypothetical protein PSTT_08298 [Puccinia striiformis]
MMCFVQIHILVKFSKDKPLPMYKSDCDQHPNVGLFLNVWCLHCNHQSVWYLYDGRHGPITCKLGQLILIWLRSRSLLSGTTNLIQEFPSPGKSSSSAQFKNFVICCRKMVPCNFTTPIQFTNQKGAHPLWTSVQVADSNIPIRSLEACPTNKKSCDGTKCKPIRPSADLRVTCLNGKKIVTNNVNLVYSEDKSLRCQQETVDHNDSSYGFMRSTSRFVLFLESVMNI